MTAASKEVKILKPTAADQKLKIEALEAWDRSRLELVLGSPFLGSLAMHLQLIPVVDDRCPTAATDGRRVFFNAQYMLDRSEEDAIFILAHEVLHCALMHFPVNGEKWKSIRCGITPSTMRSMQHYVSME